MTHVTAVGTFPVLDSPACHEPRAYEVAQAELEEWAWVVCLAIMFSLGAAFGAITILAVTA